MTEKRIIIGVGNPGRKILSRYETKLPKLYIDTDPDVLELKNALRIGVETCGKYSSLGESAKGEFSVIESKQAILSCIQNYSEVFIVTALGGGTSSGATKRLTDLCIELNKKVQLIVGIPLELEGGTRFRRAMDTLIYLELIAPTTVINYNRFIPEERFTLGKLYEEMNAIFHERLNKLLNDTDCVEGPEIT